MTIDDSETLLAPPQAKARGGKFFVLDRDIWAKLWEIETRNRLNLVTAFLVLLAGTGADHRLTKWSAKACEERAGLGKPRAKIAIAELIAGGLAEMADTATRNFPHYRLAKPASDKEPIFLPVQLITGFAGETPVLRRIRENGDPLLLRMLIDLYGLIEMDACHGIPIAHLRTWAGSDVQRKVLEKGSNAIWALHLGGSTIAGSAWAQAHIRPHRKTPAWDDVWQRLGTLQKIGALWFEPWVFDGVELDAEPLYPVEIRGLPSRVASENPQLRQAIDWAVDALADGKTYLWDKNLVGVSVIVPTHHRAPALRGVAKLRVEADTPGRRAAYARRLAAIETATSGYQMIYNDALKRNYSRPIQLRRNG